MSRFNVRAHIPRGSGDAEYHIMLEGTEHVVAIIDPEMVMTDPAAVADAICDAMNANPDAIL